MADARPKRDLLQDHRNNDATRSERSYCRTRVSRTVWVRNDSESGTRAGAVGIKRPDLRNGHVADHSAKGLAESAANLEKATGGKCIATAADVREPAALKKAVEDTLAKFGRIDFVICGESPVPPISISANTGH